jgi:hypothetical protein
LADTLFDCTRLALLRTLPQRPSLGGGGPLVARGLHTRPDQVALQYRLLTSRPLARYNLGPNGGILTALNLFTTKFDQVLGHVEKRASTVE